MRKIFITILAVMMILGSTVNAQARAITELTPEENAEYWKLIHFWVDMMSGDEIWDEFVEQSQLTDLNAYYGTGGADGRIPNWIFTVGNYRESITLYENERAIKAMKEYDAKHPEIVKKFCKHNTQKVKIIDCATCTKDGKYIYYCTLCGKETKTFKEKALGHDYHILKTYEGNCKLQAVTKLQCSRCGDRKDEIGDYGNHNYILKETKVGDCKHETAFVMECTICKETDERLGNFGTHKYVETENCVPETCLAEGYKETKCSVCGDVQSEIVLAHGHVYTEEKVVLQAPTCTSEGRKAFRCEYCGDVKDEVSVEALGHSPTAPEVFKEPTFYGKGESHILCSTCKQVIEIIELPASGGIWRFIFPAVISMITCAILYKIRKLKKKKCTKKN